MFAENCMNMKEMVSKGGVHPCAPLESDNAPWSSGQGCALLTKTANKLKKPLLCNKPEVMPFYWGKSSDKIHLIIILIFALGGFKFQEHLNEL